MLQRPTAEEAWSISGGSQWAEIETLLAHRKSHLFLTGVSFDREELSNPPSILLRFHTDIDVFQAHEELP
jgi:hypothetical protein